VVTYDVAAPNADLALLPGLTANIRIVTDHRDAALRCRPRLPQPGGFTSLTVSVWSAPYCAEACNS
jgi:hypothetical protein